jgi:glycosyltransferase involved in cell wall biosynthesis
MTPKSRKFEGHFLSIIIPAYRAEKFIENNLLQVREVLQETRYPYEIICVVDGDVDDTRKKAQKVSEKYADVIVTGYSINMGKGHAVRFGMAKSKGDIVGFIDAGLELDPNGLSMLLEHFEWYKADIIVGSKRHPASKVVYPWQRKLLSFGYQVVVRVLFGLRVKDTQVGLKFFRRDVLERILPRVLVKTFAFDVELLSVAYYLGYKRIFEAPVELDMKFKGGFSTIASKGFINTAWGMLWDTAAVFYRLRILHYYDDKNKNNWITENYLTLNSKT